MREQAGQASAQRSTQRRQERVDRRAQEVQQRLEQRARQGRLTRSQYGQLQSLQERQTRGQQRAQLREQMRQGVTQQRLRPSIEAHRSRRAAAYVAPQAAAQTRFAARFHRDSRDRDQWMRARRERWAGREAWRHGVRAAFVPWYGPIYWPYAYADIFDYTFWPYAYDDSYWASAYDDFFSGVFFPYGAPYVGDAYSGPYDSAGVVSSGSRTHARKQGRPRYGTIGTVSAAARRICEQPANGETAWPIEQIADAVRPDEKQRALLGDLKNAEARAADAFRSACPTSVPMTPVGRLQTMIARVQATLDAVRIIRPSLANFYGSLNDEQKARFNGMGPDIGAARPAQSEAGVRTTANDPTNACVSAKSGFGDLPIGRIDEVVRPTDDQEGALDRLRDATQKAAGALQAVCPTLTPLTPVGRLEAAEQRLNAILAAAKAIQPALETFYASLNSEQKARFNELDHDLAVGR
jgi:LTXXQ motif family protein